MNQKENENGNEMNNKPMVKQPLVLLIQEPPTRSLSDHSIPKHGPISHVTLSDSHVTNPSTLPQTVSNDIVTAISDEIIPKDTNQTESDRTIRQNDDIISDFMPDLVASHAITNDDIIPKDAGDALIVSKDTLRPTHKINHQIFILLLSLIIVNILVWIFSISFFSLYAPSSIPLLFIAYLLGLRHGKSIFKSITFLIYLKLIYTEFNN